MTASCHGNRMLWCQPLKYAKTVSTFKWANSSLNSPINCLNLAWQAPYITTVLVVVNHNLHFEKFKVREIENSNPLYILTYTRLVYTVHSGPLRIKMVKKIFFSNGIFDQFWYNIFFFFQKVAYRYRKCFGHQKRTLSLVVHYSGILIFCTFLVHICPLYNCKVSQSLFLAIHLGNSTVKRRSIFLHLWQGPR